MYPEGKLARRTKNGFVEFKVMAPKEMRTPNCYYEICFDEREYMNTICFAHSDEPRPIISLLRKPPRPFRPTSPMERALFSVLRLENERGGSFMPVGTSFVFYFGQGDGRREFIVTNRHIVEKHTNLTVVFHLGQRDWVSGVRYTIPNLPELQPTVGRFVRADLSKIAAAWTFHPDADIDLAVYPLGPILEYLNPFGGGNEQYYSPLSVKMVPDDNFVAGLDVVENVQFIGYPSGIYDSYTQLPIVRQGVTATPYLVDYEGRPTFLIDAPVFEGSSGSPVFVSGRARNDKHGHAASRADLVLLGIVARHRYIEVERGGQSWKVERNLGEVFRAHLILEAIDAAVSTGNDRADT